MTILDGLNEQQRQVVLHDLGPLLVSATAGSGKTTALARRVAQLVAAGVDPRRILAVTFSVKAAKEMTDRLVRIGCNAVPIRTFHSLALTIVRTERPELSAWMIDDKDRYRICVKDAVSFRYMDWRHADVTHLLSYIARCKAAGASPSPTDAKAVAIATAMYKRCPTSSRDPSRCRQAYETAELIRHERQLLTFDDMLFEAWELFGRDDEARNRWAARFDYVLQDECQDENTVQHELGAYLARDHRNYMVVGDVAQSIYGFRGADPGTMIEFEKEWGARVIAMNTNYRCASSIVDVANRILGAMPVGTHLGVSMIAARPDQGRVQAVKYSDFDEEGEGVTERILESNEDGRDWKSHVVLYRTNAQSRGIEEALLKAGVPYVVLGGTNFYDRREVKDLLAYLRVAAGSGSFDDVKRSINTPFRFLGRAFIEGLQPAVCNGGPQVIADVKRYVLHQAQLQSRQRESALGWCDLVGGLAKIIEQGRANRSTSRDQPEELFARPHVLLEALVADLRYCDWLTRDEGAESPENNRVSNVRELIRAVGRFLTVDDLLKYIGDTRARVESAKRAHARSDVVTLCSIHRAKGLEWPVVFVLGCNEKILPHAHAEDFNEERRLFYVACTRAADVLQLSYVAKAAVSNRVLELKPSQFMVETGLVETSIAEAS